MTISSETRKAGPFPGNGVTTAFPFAFKVFTAADLAVTLNVLATGVQTTLTLTSDYTVALNPDQNANPGGTVTYNPSGIPMPSTKTLTIGSALANTQGYQPTNSGGWLPSNAGDAWDRAVILIQQAAEKVTRSLKFPIVDGALISELPPAAQRANNLLGFDSNGNVVAVAPAAQSASALQANLADSADVTKGASMIGYLGGTLRSYLNQFITSAGASMIGWIQSGAGAVFRLVQDKLRDTVSVKDFGAVGDGVADDTAAIQAAITAVKNANGGTVFFPAGVYLCSGTLSMAAGSGVRLVGVSAGSQLVGTSMLKYTGSGASFISITGPSANFVLECLTVQYTNAAFTGSLFKAAAGGLWIDQCSFMGNGVSSAAGLVDIDACTDVSITKCYFQNAQYGILGQNSGGTGWANAVALSACMFGNLVVGAIRNPAQAWDIAGCDFENLQTAGGNAIFMDAACTALGISIHGCWFGDAAAVTSAWTWITWQGSGLCVQGCYFNGSGSKIQTAIKIIGTSYGITVNSNFFSGFGACLDIGNFLANNTSFFGNNTLNNTVDVSGTPVKDYLTVSDGTWTPTFTGLTVVNGTGGATITGTYRKIGKLVKFQAVITTTGTATTASNSSTTFINNLPFTPATSVAGFDICMAANVGTIASYGVGVINGNAYTPTWSAANNTIVISGSYHTDR